MALGISIVAKQVGSELAVTVADITGQNPYTPGGDLLTAAQVNQLLPGLGGGAVLTDTSKIQFFTSEVDLSGRTLAINKTTGKILFFLVGAEAGAIDLSAVTIRCRISYGQANLG